MIVFAPMLLLIGVLVVAIAVARMVNWPAMKSKSWPGSFASGTARQKRTIVALVPVGAGLALEAYGLYAASGVRTPAWPLFLAATVVLVAGLVLLARAGLTHS